MDRTAILQNNKYLKRISIITYAMSLIDLIITRIYVVSFGADIEKNPFGSVLMSSTAAVYIYKCIVVGAAILLLYLLKEYKIAKYGLWMAFLGFSVLTAYHLVLGTKCLSIIL